MAQSPDCIVVLGAREHNLSIERLEIPKNALVVFSGVSGSGKSSLAFDTLYAEGQRRYVESLSSYARQFLGQMEKPRVDKISGLSPTIAIEQKTASNNPRSTVGTVTEIYDYLRVLYAKVGSQRCHACGGAGSARSAAEIAREIEKIPKGARMLLLAPKIEKRKGEHREIFEEAFRAGFSRARVDGEVVGIEEPPSLDKKRKHDVELVVDRLVSGSAEKARLTDAVETAMREGGGRMRLVVFPPKGESEERLYSEARSCGRCGTALPELSPQMLSFNAPLGMCEACHGLGTRMEVDPKLLVPDPGLSLDEGAIELYRRGARDDAGWSGKILAAVAKRYKIPLKKPWKALEPAQRKILLYGTGDERVTVRWSGARSEGSWDMRFEGVASQVERRYRETGSEVARKTYEKYLRLADCKACEGTRLRPEARHVFVGGESLPSLCAMPVDRIFERLAGLELEGPEAEIAAEILKELRGRLGFLRGVGLDYLTLDRPAGTLSGGEAQRIRLASQLGSELSGVLYVLDEPSIGLHPRDGARLIATLERLRDLGNTVLVVEHDAETLRAADWIVDFGPGPGRLGGHVVAEGTPEALSAHPSSVTGPYLAARGGAARDRPAAQGRRAPKGFLELSGVFANNLEGVDVKIPLGVFCGVSGVSGAGKSSLVSGVLRPTLARLLGGEAASGDRARRAGRCRAVKGHESLDKLVDIDQQPIGRTPRSNPATYTKAFDAIRDLYAETREARAFGYGPGRFSFNVKGGRCEACEGAGVRQVEMHFLPAVHVTCEACGGRRYNEATLRVLFRGKSIADALALSVEEASELFSSIPALSRILGTLVDVGLGYLALGQPATTLSGGEAQRVKLAKELARRASGRTLYLLDEPTTGLHFRDVEKLLEVLSRLVDAGNSVVVVEHNLDVLASADWLVDLGPEGGAGGGEIVAEGPPELVVRAPRSHTGRFLRELLS